MTTPPNFLTTDTTVITPATISIEVNLNENSDVCGFGELIPVANAKTMIKDYFEDFQKIEKLINLINTTPGVPAIIKSSQEFITLTSLFNQSNHTVSGVFGKEILLQILSQKKCEGIRYFIGKHQGKPTVIIAGVRNEEKILPGNGVQLNTTISEMLPDTSTFLNIKFGSAHNRSNPPIGEVHGASKTVAEVKAMIFSEDQKQAGFTDNLEELASKVFLSF